MRRLAWLSAACIAACCPTKRAGDGSRNPWLMQSYDVPPEDAAALLADLKDLFTVSKGDNTSTEVARASVSPDGRLVIVGDREIQDGVQKLITGMAGRHVGKALMVSTAYWLVTGKPAKGETTIPPDLTRCRK